MVLIETASWLPEDWSLRTVYMLCAVLGGSILLLQLLLLFFGLGDFGGDYEIDADVGVDGDHGDALGWLSIRAIAGFFAFFGLIGLATTSAGWPAGASLVTSTASGAVVFLAVAWLLRLQRRLYSEGNVKPRSAVGKSARVYLRIPGNRGGKGKITVSIQGQELQFAAVTAAGDLPTGSEVRIVGMTTEDTFEVEPLHSVAPAAPASS